MSFFAIKIGVVRRISWNSSRNSGVLHGDYIVQSRHPCKDPANEKLPGFSFVIKAMHSDCVVSFKTIGVSTGNCIIKTQNSTIRYGLACNEVLILMINNSGLPKRLLDARGGRPRLASEASSAVDAAVARWARPVAVPPLPCQPPACDRHAVRTHSWARTLSGP